MNLPKIPEPIKVTSALVKARVQKLTLAEWGSLASIASAGFLVLTCFRKRKKPL